MPRAAALKRSSLNTREQVLATAVRLFTSQGFFNTSVHDIARESGVSIGSIYHHFKDKRGIAQGLYASLLERMVSELEAIQSRHRSTHDRCRAIVVMLFETTEAEPANLEFMLYAKHREFLPAEPPICSSRPFEIMREILAEGMERGEVIRMEPVAASAAVFGGPLRLVMARLDGVVPRPLPEYLDEVWSCAWRAVAAG